MQIKFLELQNFRNYDHLSADFSKGCSIIYGENGQGKTNILESIYMCSFGRSHKNSKDGEIIKSGCDEGHIKAEFSSEYNSHRVDMHLKKNRSKGIALDRVPLKKLGDLYGRILVVMFSAEDLAIVRRSPADRRRFIDLQLCQIDPIYMEDISVYNRILEQRRELFKKMDEENDRHAFDSTLDIWDMQLCEYGSRIIKRRREFIEELNDIIFDIHYDISGGKEKIKILYEPSSDEDSFYENIIRNRERDRIYKQTHTGPHRDDMGFYDGNTDLKIYGSNGQQRSCAISLKLSEIYIIEKLKKEKPVLLLDDVLSELDRGRQLHLIERLNDVQTIITCTGMDEFIEEKLGAVKKIHIEKGRIID
ncbi:MAG: DNA replication/repair protein RecF [Parasporobacterium sp.]|nr:DNA replication/repair protein RecF [Parasporobacterium sp.]